MSLREISTILEGVSNARKADLELAYYTAYHSGVFSQQYEKGRFPRYEANSPRQMAKRKPAGVKMDWRQMKSMLEVYNACMGGFDNRKKQ